MYEYQIQKQVFQWAKLNQRKYPQLQLLHSSMNGVKLTSALAGKRAKELGMIVGLPDISLSVPNGKYASLWIELKSEKGIVSKQQKAVIQQLLDFGNYATVCWGFDETIITIENYLEGKL